MANASSTDGSSAELLSPLFNAFHDVGPTWNLILPASLVYTVALCGICMNAFVVFVTILSTSLRGSANFLMALICLCEVLMQSGHTVFFVVTVSGTNFIRLLTANLFMLPMLFGTNTNMALMLCAAVDRLFAVAMPFLHKRICLGHKIAYLTVFTTASSLFGLYSLFYITSFSVRNPDIRTTGCISEILTGEVGNQYFILTTMLNALCVICYLLIWAIVRYTNGVTKETNTRLLRSLVVIMLVTIGGYFINLSIYQTLVVLANTRVVDPVHTWQLGFIAGVLLNMGAAANAPILYLNSTEYRKVFKRHLSAMALYCRINRWNQTTSTSAVQEIRRSSHQPSRSTGANYY